MIKTTLNSTVVINWLRFPTLRSSPNRPTKTESWRVLQHHFNSRSHTDTTFLHESSTECTNNHPEVRSGTPGERSRHVLHRRLKGHTHPSLSLCHSRTPMCHIFGITKNFSLEIILHSNTNDIRQQVYLVGTLLLLNVMSPYTNGPASLVTP